MLHGLGVLQQAVPASLEVDLGTVEVHLLVAHGHCLQHVGCLSHCQCCVLLQDELHLLPPWARRRTEAVLFALQLQDRVLASLAGILHPRGPQDEVRHGPRLGLRSRPFFLHLRHIAHSRQCGLLASLLDVLRHQVGNSPHSPALKADQDLAALHIWTRGHLTVARGLLVQVGPDDLVRLLGDLRLLVRLLVHLVRLHRRLRLLFAWLRLLVLLVRLLRLRLLFAWLRLLRLVARLRRLRLPLAWLWLLVLLVRLRLLDLALGLLRLILRRRLRSPFVVVALVLAVGFLVVLLVVILVVLLVLLLLLVDTEDLLRAFVRHLALALKCSFRSSQSRSSGRPWRRRCIA